MASSRVVATRIGGYEIVQHLASGGMGKVYLARREGPGGFERHVVLKVLDIKLPEGDPRLAEFLDEARVIGTMYHQHIAPAFEVARGEDGRYFLAMEYIHGRSAALVWDRTIDVDAALPLDFVLTACASAASALHYAHTRRGRDGRSLGIVHRDVSLSNLMIGFDGAIKLIDFGIVKTIDRSTVTQVGFVKGKVGYMAPEQLEGGALDARTDVFALGIVLYELATMTRAFREETDIATMERIKKCDYVPPSEIVESFPTELEDIIKRALRKNPAERYPDAATLGGELAAFAHAHRYVMGDAAITQVMAQLFDDREEPWAVAEGTPRHVEDGATVPIDTTQDRVSPRRDTPRPPSRHLKTASELLDLEISAHKDHKDRFDQTPTRVQVSGSVVTKMPLAAPPTGPVPIVNRPLTPPKNSATMVVPRPERPARPTARRPSPLIWIVPLVIAVGAAGAAWTIHEGYLGARPQTRHDAGSLLVQVTDAAPADAPIDAAPAQALPSHVHLHITTTPSDATVLLDGKRLGHTPLDVDVPADSETHTLKIRRRGYETHVYDVLLDDDLTQDITLDRQD